MEVALAQPPDASAWPESLRLLAARGQARRYRKGMLLIQEGDHSDTLFIVLSGRVKAFSTDDRDREITYGTYGPGEYLGEMSLDGGPRSASVITIEPTECVVVTRQTLREHIAADPEFAFELLKRVIRRARIATENARNLALLDVYGRLIKVLQGLADVGGLIAERPTHQELANRVGSSREMVSRLLKDLERGGYVALEGRGLRLVRPLPPSW
ncbi:MAG TPA: Crp/Fnr family transcriptional regulator [Albitalea sp.]|uniref:Crp/Fnr family transcriptional regulator n=1 Tax=Piscinibacter sp. TaxID=1903157 RepID=UPI002ED2008C